MTGVENQELYRKREFLGISKVEPWAYAHPYISGDFFIKEDIYEFKNGRFSKLL